MSVCSLPLIKLASTCDLENVLAEKHKFIIIFCKNVTGEINFSQSKIKQKLSIEHKKPHAQKCFQLLRASFVKELKICCKILLHYLKAFNRLNEKHKI